MKNNWHYFKVVFIFVGVSLFTGMMVFALIMGLGDKQFRFLLAFIQALQISFGTALLLGLINMFVRFDFKNKKK